MKNNISKPNALKFSKVNAQRALGPIKPVDSSDFVPFWGHRTNAGRALPPYYLVYFLFVDLLGFPHTGQAEKVAWSIPIQFKDKVFMIEHRKMGLGVFSKSTHSDEEAAAEIVNHVQKAVKAAQPYFESRAFQAVQKSLVNVTNKSEMLFKRYIYFLKSYQKKMKAAAVAEKKNAFLSPKHWGLKTEAKWLGLAAIESFFSWTEHVFIHIAILNGNIKTARDVAATAEGDWQPKFKLALGLNDPVSKNFFDQLVIIRREVRNFVAHGAFGKQGEAFEFHSKAGAVPVLLPHLAGSRKFLLRSDLSLSDEKALILIDEFIKHLWSAERAPAAVYIKSGLPLILTYVSDGTYAKAMRSISDMDRLIYHIAHQFGRAADMDW